MKDKPSKRQEGQKAGPLNKESSGSAAVVVSLDNFVHRNMGSRFRRGNSHRFKPGKSGNPSGKPSARRAVNVEVITEALGRVDPKLDKSQLEIIVSHSIRRAKQGSYKDIKLMLAYGLGQPKQLVEVEGDFNLTDALTPMRAKKLAEADQTIQQYFAAPGLVAPEAPNVNVLEANEVREKRRSDALKEFALLSSSSGEADAEKPRKIRVEL